ncbi:DNA polymerase IV [uncultured Salinisphaera sp.]|uniref:DNA polymerase IV n=1 Tax=uncultured Salinisphaera sp. TaxID=359372 RepID=UPI0032B1067F|tara:strand:- start:1805 stop:2896 length:1092 start_codon:yes stop_codon:yes gene_type:complete
MPGSSDHPSAARKIVHVDMDAFYASVEQRDRPELRGLPVVVCKKSPRAVVTAASYEARPFGVRSAMPAMRAAKLCPNAVFVDPDFARYKAVSAQIREIFFRYTPHVEPLSLDEAYLDVTHPLIASPSATATAAAIRGEIRDTTGLTASAGIAPNKFLAKIASDWRKPDGQFVIKPHQVDRFLHDLDVAKIPGVGRVMRAKLADMGLHTMGELRALSPDVLVERFGRWGQRLAELARGIDERPVKTHRAAAQISAEDTLSADEVLADLAPHIQRMADKTWAAYQRKADRVARTVVLKLKTADFQILTRSYTPPVPPASCAELHEIALALRWRVELPVSTRYRLVGVGLSGFVDEAPDMQQTALF